MASLELRIYRRIRPASLVRVAAAGAVLGTAWDSLHVLTHATIYSIGLGRMPLWVPLEFAIVYVVGVISIERFGAPARDASTHRKLAVEIAWVTGVYAVTAFAHRYEWLVLALTASCLLLRWRTLAWMHPRNRLPAAALVVLGPAVEAAVIAAGIFRYTHASLGSIPLWLPLLYANAVPFAIRLTESAQDRPQVRP
jgi:hypothetical protein